MYIMQSIQKRFPMRYDKQDMTGRGRGKYWYKEALRIEGETFLREQLKKKLNGMPILYVV